MKLFFFTTVLTIIMFSSHLNFNYNNDTIIPLTQEGINDLKIPASSSVDENEGLRLLRQNCYACHSVTSKSHDDIIAPPMVAIKRRYQKEYDSKTDFVNAFVAYATDPKEENALMTGAINKFNVMPKQNFNKEELNKIAMYVYDNEIETPAWFENHFQQKHKNSKGNRKGKNK